MPMSCNPAAVTARNQAHSKLSSNLEKGSQGGMDTFPTPDQRNQPSHTLSRDLGFSFSNETRLASEARDAEMSRENFPWRNDAKLGCGMEAVIWRSGFAGLLISQ